MLPKIQNELKRLDAHKVKVSLDQEFEPRAGTLVKIKLEEAYWHMLPEEFLELLERLPSQAGDEEVHLAIEKKGSYVWHGPAPEGSRDSA